MYRSFGLTITFVCGSVKTPIVHVIEVCDTLSIRIECSHYSMNGIYIFNLLHI
jgi:hypothetical protein